MAKLRAPVMIDLLSDPYGNSVDGAANRLIYKRLISLPNFG